MWIVKRKSENSKYGCGSNVYSVPLLQGQACGVRQDYMPDQGKYEDQYQCNRDDLPASLHFYGLHWLYDTVKSMLFVVPGVNP